MSRMLEVYELLLAAYGPQSWWPGDSPLEVLVGAVLTQNTAWRNVERAIANLKSEGLLELAALHRVETDRLAEVIRPSGYYRMKARRLKNVVAFIQTRYEGSLELMFSGGLDPLREELLAINGIGPETADSILLYAGGLPTFVVDTYTSRVLKRHGWIEHEADYHAIQEHFEMELPRDVPLFNEFHALLVRVGNQHCRKTPQCEGCPLFHLLPSGGPCEPEW